LDRIPGPLYSFKRKNHVRLYWWNEGAKGLVCPTQSICMDKFYPEAHCKAAAWRSIILLKCMPCTGLQIAQAHWDNMYCSQCSLERSVQPPHNRKECRTLPIFWNCASHHLMGCLPGAFSIFPMVISCTWITDFVSQCHITDYLLLGRKCHFVFVSCVCFRSATISQAINMNIFQPFFQCNPFPDISKTVIYVNLKCGE
jgi:hypothetical protein